MNVLSLFDGMSCGRIALDRLGIEVKNYFASEIDKHAIKVSKHNYPDIKHIGDVTQVKGSELPKIDLLLGGSPCQGFSFSGKGLNFEDPRSKLFFEFVRLLKECEPKYFLFENVRMKKEHEKVITEHLGVNSILINSSLLTAQNRPRLYWTNIPNVKQPEDKGILLEHIVDLTIKNYKYIPEEKTVNRKFKKNFLQYDINGKGHKSQDQRAYYLNNKHGCLVSNRNTKILENDGRVRKTTRNEAERLQCIHDNYTCCVSEAQALKMLGNAWTVDVIVHILKGLLNQQSMND